MLALLEQSAVWAKGRETEKSVHLAFALTAEGDGEGVIYVSAMNLYRLHINGRFAGYGPARAADGYSRYDKIPFSFEKGRAEIVFEVTNYYMHGFYLSKQPGFFTCAVKVGDRVAYTTGDFTCLAMVDRILPVQRYNFMRPAVEFYRQDKCRTALYGGDRTGYPVLETVAVPCPKLLARRVPYPSFARVSAPVVEEGSFTRDTSLPVWQSRSMDLVGPQPPGKTELEGFLREECEEILSDFGSQLVYEKDGKGGEGLYAVYRFDRSYAGFLHLRVKTETGVSLYVLYDEIDYKEEDPEAYKDHINICFTRNESCSIIKWELAPGEYELTGFEAMLMRYVRIVQAGGEAEVLDVEMILYENEDIYRLAHDVADERLSLILDAAQSTLAMNSLDLLSDCPGRERAGYPNDSHFTAQAEYLLSGYCNADGNMLENYALCPQISTLPKGMIPMCYPGYLPDGIYIPNICLWTIINYHNYRKRSGDDSRLSEMREKTRGILAAFSRYENEDGLLEDLESWVFIEWSKANSRDYVKGVNYPSNMMYYRALQCAADILGEPPLRVKAGAVKAAILAGSFNGEFFEDNRVRVDGKLTLLGHITETCQYYAFFFGVADKVTHRALWERLRDEFGPARDATVSYPEIAPSNMIIGVYMRQDLLMEDGDIERMYREECGVFYSMAKRTGTLWEHLSVKNSLCHGFASYCAKWIVYMLTGYRGVEDGYAVFERRNLGVDCEIALPFGEDYLRVTVKDGALTVAGEYPHKIL